MAKPYRTTKGNTHIQEKYSGDLSRFLGFTEENDDENVENLMCMLKVLDKCYVFSGLVINKAKMMLTLFVKHKDKSHF